MRKVEGIKAPLDMGPWLNGKMAEYDPETDFAGMVNSCYDQNDDTSALLPRGKCSVVWAWNEISRLREAVEWAMAHYDGADDMWMGELYRRAKEG